MNKSRTYLIVALVFGFLVLLVVGFMMRSSIPASGILPGKTDSQLGANPNAPTIEKNLQSDYGAVSQTSITRAIADAKAYFGTDQNSTQANTTYVIHVPAGTFTISGTIDVSGVKPGPEGRLVIEGAGKDQTTLIMDPTQTGILGNGTYRVSFVGMHFTLAQYTVSQGHVVSVAPGKIILDIQPGFPTPLDITDTHLDQSQACPSDSAAAGGWGRYLKQYTDSKTDPQIVDMNEPDYAWCKAVPVAGVPGRWQINMKRTGDTVPYAVGSLIALKSKHLGDPYHFCGGSDFLFSDIEWTQSSRGIFRCGFNNVHIDNVEVLRSPPINGQMPALASPAGGPQIGEVGVPSGGHLVENSFFEGTGDDAIAFFNATGTIQNNRVYDAFGRVLLNDSPLVQLINNTIVRTRIVTEDTSGSVKSSKTTKTKM